VSVRVCSRYLTEPLDNYGMEWRCYMRDPDGYLIEVGQYTQRSLEHFKKYATQEDVDSS